MFKLIITLSYTLSAPPTQVSFDYYSLTDCLKHRQEKVSVLDEMNQESIIIGYSATCGKS